MQTATFSVGGQNTQAIFFLPQKNHTDFLETFNHSLSLYLLTWLDE